MSPGKQTAQLAPPLIWYAKSSPALRYRRGSARAGQGKRQDGSGEAPGRVRGRAGETDTLLGVRALSGSTRTRTRTRTRSGRDVWFSFQLAGVPDGATALAAVDRAVVVLSAATD